MHRPSRANFERTMRSASGVQRCGRPNLQACIVGILLIIVAVKAGVVEGAEVGSCGVANGGKICDQGTCCSKDNFCGTTSGHCGAGCQLDYTPIGGCEGDTRTGPTSAPGATTPMCGKTVGNTKCKDNLCCSKNGFCGTSGSYCYSTKGCQSQCKLTPGQIAGSVLGALGGFAMLCVIAFGVFKLYLAHQRKKAINRDSITPVHRLFPVNAAEDKDTCVDIVFCHGFAIGELEKEVWKKTWQTPSSADKPGVCWPEAWLGSDMKGKARVFALEYDANVSSDPRRKGVHTDVSEIAKNLLQCLFDSRYKIGQSNAVVLISHSFGGLVIKSLVVVAQRLAGESPTNNLSRTQVANCKQFVANIRGFIFYAVPHSGAQNLDKYINGLKWYSRWYYRRPGAHELHSPQGTLLSNIAELSRKMEDLTVQFEAFLKQGEGDHLPVFAFIEGLKVTEEVGKIVEDASAIRLSERNFYKVESANHFNVCRPSTRNEESYRKLLSVLNPIVGAFPSSHQRLEQIDVETNHSSTLSSSQSLLRPGKIPDSLPRKLTRLIRSRPNDDILPV